MNLPSILPKINHPYQPTSGQFGLGIQVFKIDSQKNVLSSHPKNQRNLIRNIQNPKSIMQSNFVLPAIPKSEKTYSDAVKTRKNITNNRIHDHQRNNLTHNPSLSLEKSITQHPKNISNINSKVIKSITFLHHSHSLNQIITFYNDHHSYNISKNKQIKQISKSTEITQTMKNRLNDLKGTNAVDDLVSNELFGRFTFQEEYEENPITDYSNQNGFQIHNYEIYKKQ